MGGNKDNDGRTKKPIRLGLRPNLNQFLILVLVNAFVGSMIGLEQTVVPLIGADEFGIQSNALVFISDLFNTSIAIQIVAWIGSASGIVVIFLMKETKNRY